MRLDLHVHTKYSPDSFSELKDIISEAKRKEIDGIAITDHSNTRISKELKALRKKTDILLIQGEEIKTKEGEIIALFVEEEIPKESPLGETLDIIKTQDAYSFIPHPFDVLRKARMDPTTIDKDLLKRIDGIETHNGRIFLWEDTVKKTISFAKKKKKHMLGGSDEHLVNEVGNCFTEVQPSDNEEELRKNLRRSRPGGSRTSLSNLISIRMIKIIKKLQPHQSYQSL